MTYGLVAGAILGGIGLARAAARDSGATDPFGAVLVVAAGFGFVGALVGIAKPYVRGRAGYMLVGFMVTAVSTFAYGAITGYGDLTLLQLGLTSLVFGGVAGPLYGLVFYSS